MFLFFHSFTQRKEISWSLKRRSSDCLCKIKTMFTELLLKSTCGPAVWGFIDWTITILTLVFSAAGCINDLLSLVLLICSHYQYSFCGNELITTFLNLIFWEVNKHLKMLIIAVEQISFEFWFYFLFMELGTTKKDLHLFSPHPSDYFLLSSISFHIFWLYMFHTIITAWSLCKSSL